MKYDQSYYKNVKQSADRIALYFYHRLATSFVKSGRVLDYGCGTGHLIKRFADNYVTYAYDVSPYALKSVSENSPHTTCLNFDGLKTGAFDLVLSLHVLEHMHAPIENLLLIHDILRERGVLLYVVPNASGTGRKLKRRRWIGYGDSSHVSLLTAEKWIAITKSAGFNILKVGTDGLWDVPYVRFLPLWMQKILFYPLPALQVITGRLFLPADCGESLIVIAQKKHS